MSYQEAPIFQKTYELYKSLHLLRNDVPKSERYALWQKIENSSLELLEILLQTGQSNGNSKAVLLARMSNRIDIMRVFIRLAFETRAVNQEKHLALQSRLDEIGRMLGGWIKNTKTD